MKKGIGLILALVMVIVCFAACGSGQQEKTTAPNASTTGTTEKPVEKENMNLLTGKAGLSDEAVGKRPVAIMINNIKASLPQYGIADADILYEILTEGGITRMMALYGDYTKVPDVCSVRSCRYYFPIFANGYDAVYFCFGANADLGYPTLKRLARGDFNYLDGKTYTGNIFARDPERSKKMAREHTAYVKGKNIPSELDKLKIRTDLLSDKTGPFFDFGSASNGDTACQKVTLNFSNSYYSTFKYNSEKKAYYKWHSGNSHMDEKAGKQLSFKNVFVLQTDVHNYNGKQIMEVDWKGGDGYYISNGTAVKIKWEKPTEASVIKFTNAETGKELKVNPGKSYIGVISSGKTSISANA